jgi:hypothetical protein
MRIPAHEVLFIGQDRCPEFDCPQTLPKDHLRGGLERNFECARKALWTEQKSGLAELTREHTFY